MAENIPTGATVYGDFGESTPYRLTPADRATIERLQAVAALLELEDTVPELSVTSHV